MSLAGSSRSAVFRLCILFGLLLFALQSACSEEERRENGVVCASSDQCLSGLCHNVVCLDPSLDEDGDGLLNSEEAVLNTNPFNPDSDGDGPNDLQEVGSDLSAPLDADGDNDPSTNQSHDALESMSLDSDNDCIEDQFDPDDKVAEEDASEVARLACPGAGVCGDASASVEALCDDAVEPPVRTCLFDGVPGYEPGVPGELSCDGLDNDCDGFIDEGISYLAPQGAAPGLGESCSGQGACADREGTVECDPATLRAICSVNQGGTEAEGAQEEIACNNQDDDCNGVTDEGVTLEVEDTKLSVGEPCVAPGACSFSGSDQGASVVECVLDVEGLATAVCSTGPGGSMDGSEPELCDTLDNDCDGAIDEGVTWTAAAGSSLALGEPCGAGVCEGGTVVCIAGLAACSTFSLASNGLETCNGLDDDCDGLTDEPAGLELSCPKLGVCADLEPLKVGCDGDQVYCSFLGVDGYEAGEESSCNGLDDDCDGLVDEGLMAPDGSELGSPCKGQGACSSDTGSVACGLDASGDPALVCTANLENGTAEMCNSIDDDCDGLTDEDASGAPTNLDCLVGGVCQGQEDTGALCSDGEWLCAYTVVDTYEAEETTCDGLDNDCDDQIDEGVSKSFEPDNADSVETQPAHRGRWPMAVAGDSAWLYGGLHLGHGGDGPVSVVLDDLWSLNVEEGVWSRATVDSGGGPGPRWGHAVAWLPGLEALLVSGGHSSPNGMEAPEGELWAFFPATKSWKLVGQESSGVGPEPSAWHSLTPVAEGTVLRAGGGPSAETWLGTLALEGGEEGVLTCSWELLPAGPAGRVRHAAVYRPDANAVWLIGGGDPGAQPVLALSLDAPEAWSYPLDAGSFPESLKDGCAFASNEGVFVFGGRKHSQIPGAFSAPPVSGVWHIKESEGAWMATSNQPSSSVQFAGCVAFSGSEEGLVRVLPGAARAGASWSKTLTYQTSSADWSSSLPWTGLPPRVGATVVIRPKDHVMWAFGGARLSDGDPLQDVWRLEDDGTWTSVVKPLSLSALGADKTIPALSGAAGLWDPVSKRVLLVGGRDHSDAEVKDSKVLWSFVPDSAEFIKEVAQGDTLVAMEPGMVFAKSSVPGVAWLAGATLEASEPSVGGLQKGELELFALDLSILSWSLQPDATLPVGVSTDLKSILGGVSSEGLDILYLTEEGALAAGTYSDGAWVSGGLVAAGAYDGLISGAYDPVSRVSFVAVRTAEGASSVFLIDHDTLSADPFTSELQPGWIPPTDAALAVHPLFGAVGVGGRDALGVTRSVETLVGQTCP